MYLFGASGHGKVIKEIIESNGHEVIGFLDDNPNVEETSGKPVFHEYEGKSPVIVSIGANAIRKKVVEKLKCDFATAIHNKAVVSPSATVDEGSVVMAGVVINAESVIGKHCIINTGASVDHECVIGDFVHVSPHVTLCGGVTIGEGSWICAGTTVTQGVKIGKWCTIAAGSVVKKDIPDGALVSGSPAKVLKINKF